MDGHANIAGEGNTQCIHWLEILSHIGRYMSLTEKKKIVYLFGAGATHAELTNLDPDLLKEKLGLLIGNVSSRVIESDLTPISRTLG